MATKFRLPLRSRRGVCLGLYGTAIKESTFLRLPLMTCTTEERGRAAFLLTIGKFFVNIGSFLILICKLGRCYTCNLIIAQKCLLN